MPFLPVNYNPYLNAWLEAQPNKVGGQGTIEYPGEGENFVWQTRKAEPSQYEDDFADALEKVLQTGAIELEDIANGLNRIDFMGPGGAAWTTEGLAHALHALAEA
jgi:hypothetical protein